MTTHLGPDDFIAALEQAPAGPAAAHLAACASCRDELAALREQVNELASIDVPEPSPLFWDHFAARVREATGQSGPVTAPWWSARRFVWAWGVATAVVILVVGLRWSPPPQTTVAENVAAGAASAVEAVVFDDVAGVFETMAPDDVDAFAPAGTATWAMVDELTDEERTAFVRLIEQQMEALP
jgi:hypothetical protein